MADPIHHAMSSAKKWGGVPEDYLHIHQWFDATKAAWPDVRHRAIRHSAFGIQSAIEVFGQAFCRKSDGHTIPVRWVGEQHVLEDLGRIPTLEDWLEGLPMKDWMIRHSRRLSQEFTNATS